MIAVPWAPIAPETRIRSPGAGASGDSAARGSTLPMPGRAHVHAVGVAALDDLRVAGDDRHAGRRRGVGDRLDLGAQDVGVEALLEDERRASARAGARPTRRGR